MACLASYTSCADTKTDVNADVLSVSTTGAEQQYQFAVEIQSPDTGCEQYANWWEVLSEDGTLLYRRILAHSHVGEQPFTRSGGAVKIKADDVVYVRAHMFPSGYGGDVFKGTVSTEFTRIDINEAKRVNAFEVELATPSCAF